jgi:hypothetical protein
VYNENVTHEALLFFKRKVGSGTHSDPKLSWRRGGVSYIDASKKKGGSGTPFMLPSFYERTFGTAFRRVPSQKYPCICAMVIGLLAQNSIHTSWSTALPENMAVAELSSLSR